MNLRNTFFILLFFLFLAFSGFVQAIGVELSGLVEADEFLARNGFIVEKRFPQEIADEVFFKSTLFGGELFFNTKPFKYIRGLRNKEPVIVVELDGKITSGEEMIGDVLIILNKEDKIVDFRYYNPKTKTKHIWYDGSEPVPILPFIIDKRGNFVNIVPNSLW